MYHFCKNHLWQGLILISQQISDSLLVAAPLVYSWPLSLYGHSLMYSVSLGSAVHSWFNLKPSRSPGSVDNYYGNEWLWYFLHGMLNDGTGWRPLPPPSPLPLQFLCFLFVLLTPFSVVWIRRKLNLSKLSAAECLNVTTVCMLAVLHRQGSFFLSLCMPTNSSNYLPAYLQYLPPVCFCAKF